MVDLDTLNPPQREAVVHGAGPLVVFAGAGSGKTRVITHRIAHLISERGVPPYRILAVTFTNKAAGEMRERLTKLIGGRADHLWVGTFHSICARLLRRHADAVGVRSDFTIYDDADQKAMLTRVIRDMGLDDKRYGAKQVAAAINRAKQEVIGPEDFESGDPYHAVVQRIYTAYEEQMRRSGTLDFADLITRMVVALETNEAFRRDLAGQFEYILVDEFQDTNHVQFRWVCALASAHKNLCVVGDDDQSIYRWRGADRRNILDFQRHFDGAKVVKLEQNYRSTQRILRVAHHVIRRNVDREPKKMWTDNDEGQKVLVVRTEDERDEARMVLRAVRELLTAGRSLSDMAVFYRTHAQSRVLEESLRAGNVSYRIVGGMRFYDRAEVKDVLAYLRAMHNPDDDVSLLRIINVPARGIGKTSVERVLDCAAESGRGVWGVLGSLDDFAVIKGAAKKKLQGFYELMSELRRYAKVADSLADIGQNVVDRTGYVQLLKEQDTPEADARLENVEELVGSLAQFTPANEEDNLLAQYLELVTLQSSADEADEEDRLTLMTVHAAKGLEFPVVMVTGMEEQMFPMRGADQMNPDPDELEEERRLAYVAFTRAEQQLILSWTGVRRIFGQTRLGQPSRFVAEMPPEDVTHIGKPPSAAPSYGAGRSSYGGQRSSYGGGGGSSYGGSSYGGARSRGYGQPASTPRSSSESYVDRDDAHEMGDVMGMRVRHPKFGIGKVSGVVGGSPPRLQVHFPEHGVKQIVSTFLEPV